MTSVVPFFERNPLRTAKRADFEKFAQVLQLMQAGAHLEKDGLQLIASMHGVDEPQAAVSVSGILRGHTPATSYDSEVKIWS